MASDDFNRPDADSLGEYWFDQVGSVNVVSQTAKSVAQGAEQAFYSRYSVANDQYARTRVVAAASGNYIGPTVRASAQSPVHNAYLGVLGAAGTFFQGLYKVVNGSLVLLQSVVGDVVPNDIILLEVRGTTLVMRKNGDQLGTDQTDASLSSGSPGLHITQEATITGALDDWEGGDLTPPQVPAEIIFNNANA